MSDKAAPDTELLESFAEEARRRCDVISAGLATATTDFETMRAEAHALRGTAGVVGLRRLAELAGLMESDLAEAKTTGVIRSTVWIGPDGRVRKHWARVANAAEHPARVLEALRGGA